MWMTRSSSSRKLRILVVDDDDDYAELLDRWLRRAGHELLRARDGLQATIAAGAGAPDVVLLDLGLPCEDGFAVLVRMRRDARLGSVPIIVLTGDESAAGRAVAIGASGFLDKSVEPRDLLASIDRVSRNLRCGAVCE